MDHIPEPHDSAPEILVPLFEPIVPRDDSDFLSFGKKLGFSEGEDSTVSPTLMASRLQSWLFFGLLSEALDNYDMRYFISQSPDDPTSRFLSLKNLQACRVRQASPLFNIYGLCMFAVKTITALDSLGQLDESPAGETGLAILVLVKTLQLMTIMPSQYQDGSYKWSSAFLKRYMRDIGWCPQQISWIIEVSDPVVACFLARLRRSTSVSHSNCTEAACVANNVQLDSSYHQRHASDRCTCRSISVDVEQVKRIIRQGAIPLVSVEGQSTGQISLKVCKATANSKYVALSHVWSDGLGNPTANAIPQCQAQLISDSLGTTPPGKPPPGDNLVFGVRVETRKLPWHSGLLPRKPPLFWLDTLCIPVTAVGDSPDVQADVAKLKSRAINQMGQIYAAADRVLVLDSELQKAVIETSDDISHVEILARFVCCAWMRRCWTLQEGALAKGIVFRSASGLVTPLFPLLPSRKDYRRLKPPPGPWLYIWAANIIRKSARESLKRDEAMAAATTRPILSHLRYRLQGILTSVTGTHQRNRFFGHATPWTQFDTFCTIWNHLSYRNTTKTEDLPAIFANLLDTNAYRILETQPSERMRALLRGLDALPIELLFNTGPREHAGRDCLYRWVPTHPSKTKMPEAASIVISKTLAYDEFLKEVGNSMQWVESGELDFSPRKSDDFLAIVLDGTDGKHGTCVIQADMPDSDRQVRVLVRIKYPEIDEMQRDDRRRALILLDTRTENGAKSTTLGGCLFQLIEIKEDANRLVCSYDSPLTWSDVSSDDLSEHPVVAGSIISHPFSFEIKIDGGDQSVELKQRPSYKHWIRTIEAIGYVPMCLLLGIRFLSIVIRAIIEIRLGWSNLSALGKAATIIFACEATGVLSPFIPPPLAEILFIVDRIQTVGHLSAMDMAYVILSLLGNMWFISVWLWLLRRFARFYIYRRWLESFEPSWPDGNSWFWKVYFYMGREGYRVLRRLFKKTEARQA